MNLGIPQLIYLALLFIGLGMECARHGRSKTGTYNGWTSLISVSVIIAILYLGEFFN